MKVSVFTPLTANGNGYVAAAYETLCEQTHTDWEWVVLENHGGHLPEEARVDPRVRIYSSALEGVGALKLQACQLCNGEILFELDHDDLLHCQALQRTVAAVEGGADFVYSDFAEFRDGTWEPNQYGVAPKFGEAFGWKAYPVDYKGHQLLAYEAPSDPVAWRGIYWAPNHLRAWRRSFYEAIGGHDPALVFADDHDLVLRTWMKGGKCVRVPECLYFYRVHSTQNVKVRNAEIQSAEGGVYHRHVFNLFEKEARFRELKLIDLCGGINTACGYEPWDISLGHDLDQRWPAVDSTVGVIRAFDAIEHLRDKVHTMNEAWRVLAPGGALLVWVPSTDCLLEKDADGNQLLYNGSGAYCDPTHVSYWNEQSFRYYTQAEFQKYVPAITARFQVARLRTVRNGVLPYVQAELIALKPGYEPMGVVGF